MAVLNIHERALPASEEAVGALLDDLSGPNDRLWPHERWPALRFDRPLGVGASGGHGPIGYVVTNYVPGRWLRARFTAPRGCHGFHEYDVRPGPDGGAVLRHTLAIHARGPARLSWPLVFRPLHDALLEDSLDNAERVLCGAVARPARWSAYVRLLRRGLMALGQLRGRGRTERARR